MTENKDSKNPIAQDNTTNELSEKDVASVSGGSVPDASFATKNNNFMAQNETQLSDHKLASIQ